MEHLFLALLISGLCGASSAHSRHYYFINESKTWFEARSYCRANYTDLATVDNMEDMKQLMTRLDPRFSGSVWIGLRISAPRRWGWSSGEVAQYINWKSMEPNGGDQDGLCAAKNAYNGWVDAYCSDLLEFVCYNETSKQFIHVRKQDKWRNAQAYCRQYHTDLATIHDEEEHQYLSDLLGNIDYVWIGLFFDIWKWSDRRSSTFRYWKTGEPWTNLYCAYVDTAYNGQWGESHCSVKLPFMCYKAQTRIVKLTVTSSGDSDLNDPAVKKAILSKIETEFRKQDGTKDATLTWREKNGEVFHLVKKRTVEDNTCG